MSNTLSKTITSKFFATESGYDEMRRRWLKAVNDKEVRKTLTASHHALYTILSGKNLGKSFTPISNQVKLDNGARPYGAAIDAINRMWSYDWSSRKYVANPVVWEMFKDLLSDNAGALVRAVVPSNSNVESGNFEYAVSAMPFVEVA